MTAESDNRPLLIKQLTAVNSLYRLASQPKATDDDRLRYVDSVFSLYPFRQLNTPAKMRIVRTQRQYAATKEVFISEQHLVEAFNRLVDETKINDYHHTSEMQVRLCRMFLFKYAPSIIGAASSSSDLSNLMTPGEAALVLQFVVTQKLINPDFQTDPAKWSEAALYRASHPKKRTSDKETLEAHIEVRKNDPQIRKRSDYVAGQLADPGSWVSHRFDRILTDLQIVK